MDYCFQVQSLNYNYSKSLYKAFRFNIIFALVFFGLLLFLANIQSAIAFSLLLFISLHFKSLSHTKYFVPKLEIKQGHVFIMYNDKGEEKNISGLCSDFRFKKNMSISRARDPYLTIYYKDDRIIEQFLDSSEEWKEKDFDEAIKALQDCKY